MDKSGELDLPDVIIGGDFNLTLSNKEIWGKNVRGDALRPFFNHLFNHKGLIDLAPLKLVPTWRNEREGMRESTRGWTYFYPRRLFLLSWK